MTFILSTLIIVIFGILWTLYFQDNGDNISNVKPNGTYDYIIVGAGSSGAVLANRLSEDPKISVLLIEAGESDYGNDKIRIPLIGGGLQHSSADWHYYTEPQKFSHLAANEQRSYWPRGKVLGGSSSLNTLVYVRGSRHDFDQWAEEGCKGWSYKDVLPFYIKTENYQMSNTYESAYHGKDGFMTLTDTTVTPMSEIYREAAEELGYKTVDVNGKDQIGFSYTQSSINNGERCNTASCYLRPVAHRTNLHITTNSFVTKIIIKNKVAVGVEVIKDNRKTKIFSTKEVILSAGAVNSPQILMLSGIGPKKHLEEQKIPIKADLPVGENLEEHLLFLVKHKINQSYTLSAQSRNFWNDLRYQLTKTGPLSSTAIEGLVFDRMPNRDSSLQPFPDYQIQLFSVALDDFFYDHGLQLNLKEEVKDLLKTRTTTKEFTSALIQLHPKSTGTIRLTSDDPFDYPRIQPNYFKDPDDLKSMIAGIRKILELGKTKTMQKIGATLNRQDYKTICDGVTFDTDAYWECMLRHFATTCYHPTSTCRMGSKDDPTAVVDPELRVKGIKNLRVADASVMRHVTSGNTNAPCIMIGEKAADLILGKDTVGKYREQISHLKL